MAGVFDCGICENKYDENDRKPLALLCGHLYCQQCLHNVVSGSSPACPSCRKEIVTPVNELPVIFALISPTGSDGAVSKSMVNRESSCSAHQNELDYWCTQCQILICKRCLVEAHADHKLTLTEEMIGDKKLLSDKKECIVAELQQTKSLVDSLRQLESLADKIEKAKSYFSLKKNSMLKHQLVLSDWVNTLEKISSEPCEVEKSIVLKIFKHQTQTMKEVSIGDALREFDEWVSECQVSTDPDETPDKPFGSYMPDGQQWDIISNELAEKALHTMKETDHKTPKAIVVSTDDDPILCLPELLQYLTSSSASMELQLMDRAKRKYPDKKDWFPRMAGGEKSTDLTNCYRLQALADTLLHFETLAAAKISFGQVVNYTTQNKVIALVNPATRTYDVCVLTFGTIVKCNTGSWPLPLEVHVIDIRDEHVPWVKNILPIFYPIAQPSKGECRVYLPEFGGDSHYGYASELSELCPVLADLGEKFSTQHRLYLPACDAWLRTSEGREAEPHRIALEYRRF